MLSKCLIDGNNVSIMGDSVSSGKNNWYQMVVFACGHGFDRSSDQPEWTQIEEDEGE